MGVFNVYYQFQVAGLFFFKFRKIKFGGIVKQEIKLVSPYWKCFSNICMLQSADNTSAKIKLLANKNEGATSMTPRDRLENVDLYTSSVFIKSASDK